MSVSWPYDEAQKVIPTGEVAVFETGYGPSGLPHIGTFTEVLRTDWVRRAYAELTGAQTRLIVFSDDMDAMRKVPENVPQQDRLKLYEGKSLNVVPDPFGCCTNFAAHNNGKLCDYLDSCGFDYEFVSSTECYRSGMFDATLLEILANFDTVRDIILPTLGQERRETYCPFMPILEDGTVLDTGYVDHNPEVGTVIFEVDGQYVDFPVTGGRCKLQWKCDWAMRWIALGVDYEMAGKDLTDSVRLSSEIVKALGHAPPAGMIYEMFLDKDGRKISKSVGNGMSIDDWLRYGSGDSLAYYLYREPQKAKKLHVGLVAHATDDLWRSQREYHDQTPEQQRGNPVHFIYQMVFGEVPAAPKITYSNLLNLVKLLGPERIDVLEAYLAKSEIGVSVHQMKNVLEGVVNYYTDHVASTVQREDYVPTEDERRALDQFAQGLLNADDPSEQAMQLFAYEAGKHYGYADRLRDWFKLIYMTIFGLPDGPRIGLFIEVYGRDAFVKLLRGRLWQAENKGALDSANEWVEKNGLPLEEHRLFGRDDG
jgi:lysyl-tRNA synthetase class 1